jgi:hypothetical protein
MADLHRSGLSVVMATEIRKAVPRRTAATPVSS